MKVAFKTLCVPDADARDPRPRSRAHPAARRVGARSFSSRFRAPRGFDRFVPDEAAAVPRIVAAPPSLSGFAVSRLADSR
jgi:hypothetical protein